MSDTSHSLYNDVNNDDNNVIVEMHVTNTIYRYQIVACNELDESIISKENVQASFNHTNHLRNCYLFRIY